MFENHRPISLLPSFSKLFEMATCERLMNFMVTCSLLNNTQHGYIKGRSIETAIFEFTEKFIKAFEANQLALGFIESIRLSKSYILT